MKLTFLGATHEVTGSCTLLEACGKYILIDCGMQQGPDIFENQAIPVASKKISAVLLTHAHIDHSGLLPLIYAQGFRGKIYLTKQTKELAKIMLADSAHIQESEAEWRNRKAKRAENPSYTPLYTAKDAAGTCGLFRACEYEKPIELFKGITAEFTDAGHLLGSASIKITITERGITKTVLFSGDIGKCNKPILRDPTLPKSADYVLMESTYGDTVHPEEPDYTGELAAVLQRTFDRGGTVVIPSFAVGRTQELLYFIRQIKSLGLIKNHNGFPVYLDSPLAVEATEIFSREYRDCYDKETLELIDNGINPIKFDNLIVTVSTEDSKAINADTRPKVIISASGMCEAGRIRHHLKHHLWEATSTIAFVGYQVSGTLGRTLLEGAKTVKLFGEKIKVNAEITKISGISSHADSLGLLNWVKSFEAKPSHIFVNHGEDAVATLVSQRINDELGIPSNAPYSGDIWDLATDTCIKCGSGKRVQKNPKTNTFYRAKSPAYRTLSSAGERLRDAIAASEGVSNRELIKYTKIIEDLIGKMKKY